MNFKKFLVIGMLVLAMTGANAFAAVDTEIVGPASNPAGIGKTFDTTVKMTGPHNVGNFDLSVAFDPALIQIDSIVAAAGFGGSPPGPNAITSANATDGTGGNIGLSFLDMTLAGFDATAGQDTYIITFIISAEGTATLTPTGTIGEAPMGTDVTGTFTPANITLLGTPPNPKVIATVSGNGTVTSDSGTDTGIPGEKEYEIEATPIYTLTPESAEYKVDAFTIDGTDEITKLNCGDDGVCTYQFAALAEGASVTMGVTFAKRDLPTVTAVVGINGGMVSDSGTSTANPGEKEYPINATPVYTVTLNSGYKIVTFTKDGEDRLTALVDNGDGTFSYTFAPLAEGAAITLAVSFGEVVKPVVTATGDANVVLSSASGTVIEPGKKSYEVNATPIYTITPDTGYKIASLMVDGADVMADLDLTNNTYTFAPLVEGKNYAIIATSAPIGFPTITGTAGAGGTLTVDGADATGAKSYEIDATPAYKATPDANYVIDTFTVDGTDVTGDTYTFGALQEGDSHIIDVTFKMDNAVPTATAGTLEAEVGSITTDQLAGEDTDGTIASFQIVTNPTKGFVDITDAATGAYSFEARSTAVVGDTDTFTFTVTDDKGAVSEPATINVTFIKMNNPPVPDAGLILEASATGTTVGQLTATDAEDDPLTYRIVDQPETGGIVKITDAATGAYTFTPFAGATGTVTFTFQVNDGTADAAAPGTVTVNIGLGGNAPVAQDGTLNIAAGATVTGMLIATDADPGDVLTFSIVDQPANGAVALTDTVSGAYEYTANSDADGADKFTFKATDNNGAESNIATVNVTVIPGIEVTGTAAPAVAGSITPDITSVIEGGEVTFTITVNETWEIDTVMDNGVDVTSELTAENTYTLSGITEPHDIIVTLIPEVVGIYSSADYGAGNPEEAHDYKISLSELLRVVQFYTIGAYHCDLNGEDGYAAGDGDTQTCEPNTSDYLNNADQKVSDWEINLSELLRIVQFYVLGGYHVVPEGEADLEGDGFIAGYEIVIK